MANLGHKVRKMQGEGRDVRDIADRILQERRARRLGYFRKAAVAVAGLALWGGIIYGGHHLMQKYRSVEPSITAEKAEPAMAHYPGVITYRGVGDPKRIWISDTEHGGFDDIDYVELKGREIVVFDSRNFWKGTFDTVTGAWKEGWRNVDAPLYSLEASRIGSEKKHEFYIGLDLIQFEQTADTFFGLNGKEVVWSRRIKEPKIVAKIYDSMLHGSIDDLSAGVYEDRLFLMGGGWSDKRVIQAIDLGTGNDLWTFDMKGLGQVFWPIVDSTFFALGHETGVVLVNIDSGNPIVNLQMGSEGGPWRYIGSDGERYFIAGKTSLMAFQRDVHDQ